MHLLSLSLIHNIFSLLFFRGNNAQIETGRASLSNRRDENRQKKTKKKTHVVYWKTALSDRAKTLESRKQTIDSRVAERGIGNIS